MPLHSPRLVPTYRVVPQIASREDGTFFAVEVVRIRVTGVRELAEGPKTCGNPFFGTMRLRTIDECDCACPEPPRAENS